MLMFSWWGAAMSRLRWGVLILAGVLSAFAAIWGAGVFGSLSEGGFEQPGSESERAIERIDDEVGRQGVDLIALYSSDRRTVADPQFRDAVLAVAERVGDHPDVTAVQSIYTGNHEQSLGNSAAGGDQARVAGLVSKHRHATYLGIQLAKDVDQETIREIRDDLSAEGLTTRVGGPKAMFLEVNDRVAADIARAEMISMPILLVLLAFVFGSLVAATTPLLVGGLAIVGAFTVVRGLTYLTDVSVFSINIITILGLGLAIDYALFMVSRFREELERSRDTPQAVAATMATAGRTVAVSGVTVALALSGLLLFPQVFLRSMGIGGIAAVAVAMTVSLTVLPALLAVLGRRVDALRLPFSRRRRTVPTLTGALARAAGSTAAAPVEASQQTGGWARFARSVMRRPVLYALAATGLLLLLAAPFTRAQFGGVDERVLPEAAESRVVAERVQDFPGSATDPIQVLVSGADARAAAGFAEKITTLAAVRDAKLTAQRGDSGVITVSYRGEFTSDPAQDVVKQIRGFSPPDGAEVLVGGPTANLVDLLQGLADRLPWMAALVAGVTFVLLFLAFGSVVLPLKAILMNLLSIGASFGAVVWVFQDGHFADLLGFTSTGFLEATQPILMLAVLFGLSMDYEVFLLSRVREQWDQRHDNTAAVAAGVQRTGGVITAAALLLAVVVGAFATSGITFVKMIGLGMLVAVIVDATVVRLVLVPAAMRLLGRHNWWAPRFLTGVYRRYGIRESEPAAPSQQPSQQGRADPGQSGAPAWASAR